VSLNALSGKGNYFTSLTAMSKSLVLCSTGSLIAMLLLFIPVAGVVLAALVMAFFVVMSNAVLVKSLMSLAGVDLLTALVSLGIMYIGVIVSLYTVVVLHLFSSGLLQQGATL